MLEPTARHHPRPIRVQVRARKEGGEERPRGSQLGLRRGRRPMLKEGDVSLEDKTSQAQHGSGAAKMRR